MSTPEERLKVAVEVLGDHAWVKTWIQHTAVVKLLEALIERDAKLVTENENVHHFLDLLECAYCHELEEAHGEALVCMLDDEAHKKTVYTPRVVFNRIVVLEQKLKEITVCDCVWCV